MNKNSNVCNNCGKLGHQFNQCKLPIVSYGVIVFSYFDNVLKFLMIILNQYRYKNIIDLILWDFKKESLRMILYKIVTHLFVAFLMTCS